jgi:hypothetical protein
MGGGNGHFPGYNPICIAGPQMNKKILRRLLKRERIEKLPPPHQITVDFTQRRLITNCCPSGLHHADLMFD